MREYFARAVNRAAGRHTAPLVMPNHLPVFPPASTEAAPASLEAQGELIFRHAALAASVATVPASQPQPMTSASPTIVESEHTTAIPLLPQWRNEATSTPHARVEQAVSAPSVSQQLDTVTSRVATETPKKTIPAEPAERRVAQITAVRNAIAAVVRAIESPSPRTESPRELSQGSSKEPEKVSVPTFERREIQNIVRTPREIRSADTATQDVSAQQVITQKVEHRVRQEHREPREMVREMVKVAPQQASVHEMRASPEETSVQVSIGRVEVRVAAPASVSAPPAAKPRGPRGFAEYEAVRRYATRNRM